MSIERRSFLQRMSLGLTALAAAPIAANASEPVAAEAWLDGLIGKHKQYFDVAAHGAGAPLRRVQNFLDVYGQTYGLTDLELNVVFGAHGTALPLVLDHALWARYQLGAQLSIDDPATKAPAVRNIFADADGTPGSFQPSVIALRKRGVRFIACRQSIERFSRELAAKHGGVASRISEELVAGLVPGVIPVPAAIVAVSRAQEAGLTYVYLG